MKDATTSLKVGVGVLLLLLSSLLSPAHSETSENLINNQNWDGATYGNDPGGCCASVSGSGALYDLGTDTILYSYGTDVLSQTIAINEALKSSGIEVDGYNYAWTWRRISNNGRGGDTLRFDVQVKDSNGNPVENYSYDYSNIGVDDNWYTNSGTETFASPHVDPQSITLRIIGKDGGFWGGYYGPEIKDVSLTLNYSANPCAGNPLYDPSCEGYAEAYAQYEYDQSCSADPLYDSGCSGYQQAYYNQQCSYDPLYDQGCPNYAQAYYDQQCSIDPLYDTGCTGYAEAYHDYQCSVDALYDTTCDGYQQAYLDYQCSLDSLYDSTCEGYAEAYAKEYILNAETSSQTETVSTSSETIPTITSAETLTETPITGDTTVDQIIGELDEIPTTTMVMEVSSVETTPTESTTQERETETTAEADTAGEMEELIADVETEESTSDSEETETTADESGGDDADGENSSDKDGSESKDSEDKKESKREKMKKAIAKKASQLANDMSAMASLEAQQAVQAQVLALINYVPDFNKYNTIMNGGYYADAQGYPDATVPESKRGLRNGLAQQLLHEKMVEMQYD
jgi:hypothetical protein